MAVRVPKELATRDPSVVAPIAGLRYLSTDAPGWTRRPRGKGFSFLDETGSVIREPERLRLVRLAVPPAWADVWLAPLADGYLQATGVDDAGRTQYRYHDAYRALCDARKFDRIRYFGRALPDLRRYIADAVTSPEDSKERALGAVLGVIDEGLLRVGNEQSASDGHYGATTLAADHVDQDGHIALEYVAKSGKVRRVVIENQDLGDILSDLAHGAEDRLFTYCEERTESRRSVTAADVNTVIAAIAGPAFCAKDFRTWGGSRVALEARVEGLGTIASVDAAAEALGNTRAVARSSYVHPAVLEATDEEVADAWSRSRRSATSSRGDRALAKLLDPQR